MEIHRLDSETLFGQPSRRFCDGQLSYILYISRLEKKKLRKVANLIGGGIDKRQRLRGRTIACN